MSRASSGVSWGMATVRFAWRRCSAAPACALDIFNGGPNNNQPHLARCGNFSGQLWNIIVTEDGDLVRLTTKFRGPGMCLDIFNGGPNDGSSGSLHQTILPTAPDWNSTELRRFEFRA